MLTAMWACHLSHRTHINSHLFAMLVRFPRGVTEADLMDRINRLYCGCMWAGVLGEIN